jgi:hypothetical protein
VAIESASVWSSNRDSAFLLGRTKGVQRIASKQTPRLVRKMRRHALQSRLEQRQDANVAQMQTGMLPQRCDCREDLVGAGTALCNQLRAELRRFWPGPIGLLSDPDRPVSLTFRQCYPSSPDARGLREKRMAAFLNAYRYGDRRTAGQVLARLRFSAGRVRRARDAMTRPDIAEPISHAMAW